MNLLIRLGGPVTQPKSLTSHLCTLKCHLAILLRHPALTDFWKIALSLPFSFQTGSMSRSLPCCCIACNPQFVSDKADRFNKFQVNANCCWIFGVKILPNAALALKLPKSGQRLKCLPRTPCIHTRKIPHPAFQLRSNIRFCSKISLLQFYCCKWFVLATFYSRFYLGFHLFYQFSDLPITHVSDPRRKNPSIVFHRTRSVWLGFSVS